MVTDKNEIFKNKQFYAKKFSEGNQDLEQFLLFLWNLGIETRGCCSGHLETDRKSYIGIKMENEYINELLEFILNAKTRDMLISFLVDAGGNRTLSLKMSKEKELFKHLNFIATKWGKFVDTDKNYSLYKKIVEFLLSSEKKYTLVLLKYEFELQKENCCITSMDKNVVSMLKDKYKMNV